MQQQEVCAEMCNEFNLPTTHSLGFSATLATLDSATNRIPKDTEGPVVVITASFEGSQSVMGFSLRITYMRHRRTG